MRQDPASGACQEKLTHSQPRAQLISGLKIADHDPDRLSMTHGKLRYRKTGQRRDTRMLFPFNVQELPSRCGPSRQYRIHKVLGTGNSAIVLQAAVLGKEYDGRKVALKCLKGRREVCLYF